MRSVRRCSNMKQPNYVNAMMHYSVNFATGEANYCPENRYFLVLNIAASISISKTNLLIQIKKKKKKRPNITNMNKPQSLSLIELICMNRMNSPT